ncbi:YciI family protein [Muricoccus radiodurans]|uniref:YciI family protein n=1 Tax=Muricoccus radiodurans TaxID=2231721 RepID=UPI003CF13F3B
MPLFLSRLFPPRPSFLADMTPEEGAVMGAHAAYWSGLAERGIAILFGPVPDPAGLFGAGVLEAADLAAAQAIVAEDPALRSGLGFAGALHEMPGAVLGRRVGPA